MVAVAQLVRAPDCDSGGRGFESRLPPHLFLSPKQIHNWATIEPDTHKVRGFLYLADSKYLRNFAHCVRFLSFESENREIFKLHRFHKNFSHFSQDLLREQAP